MDKSAVPSLLAHWREASQRATDAEREMFDATMQYTSGRGPKPTDEFMAEVKALRAEAGELFKQVMAQSQGDQGFTTRPAPDQHTQH
jgi:hypothetical protein